MADDPYICPSTQKELMTYNTSRNGLKISEYGRHVQRMVEYVMTIEDREARQKQANAVIELMGILNPHLRNVEDFRHKLWDHLFFISDFQLDVDSPYPIPKKETYKVKPEPLPYPKRKPRYNHLGKNLELVIDKALKEENEEKREGLANTIAYYMKLSYSSWHKELVQDDAIRNELESITEGKLSFSNTPYIRHRVSFESDDYPAQNRNRKRMSYSGGNRSKSGNVNGNRMGTNRNEGNRPGGNGNNRNANNRPKNGGGFKKRFL